VDPSQLLKNKKEREAAATETVWEKSAAPSPQREGEMGGKGK
jgi:hypothetical protein